MASPSTTMTGPSGRVGTLAAIVLLSLAVLSGCGGAAGDVGPGERTSGASEPPFGRVPAGDVACESARVELGSGVEAIDFAVACARPVEGKVGFAIGRGQLDWQPQAREGITRIDSRPWVTGPGAVRDRGTCSLQGDTTYCEARSRGRVVVHGSFDVPPTTRCTFGVIVRVVIDSSCDPDDACHSVVRERFLADGAPRGC